MTNAYHIHDTYYYVIVIIRIMYNYVLLNGIIPFINNQL